jgi:hypothetical protein
MVIRCSCRGIPFRNSQSRQADSLTPQDRAAWAIFQPM